MSSEEVKSHDLEENKSNVLNCDILLEILSYLTSSQRICLERVSKQFQMCVKYLLDQEISLKVCGYLVYPYRYYYPKTEFISASDNLRKNLFKREGNGRIDLIKNKDIILRISRNFKGIKNLSFTSFMSDSESIANIINAFENIDSLYFCSFEIKKNEFSSSYFQEFGQTVSQRIKRFYSLSVDQSKYMIEIIEKLTNLKILFINLNPNLIPKLFQSLPNSLTSLYMQTTNNFLIPEEYVQNLVESNAKHIRRLCIPRFILTQQSLNLIIENFNFDLLGIQLKVSLNEWQSVLRVADKQKDLSILELLNDNIIDYDYNQINSKFLNLKTLLLYSRFKGLNVFENFLTLFPRLKTLILIKIEIKCLNGEKNCKTCYQQMFHLIAKRTEITKLVLHSEDLIRYKEILQQMVAILIGFKSLNQIHVTRYWDENIVDYNRICRLFVKEFADISYLKSKKLFRIKLLKDAIISDDIHIPRNLRIERTITL